MSNRIDVSNLVDNSRVGAFHVGVGTLCGIGLMFTGFNVQAMGYVAPAIIREWKVPGAEFGAVFSAAFLGVLVCSLLAGIVADRIGRRPVLIACTLFFGVVAFLTAQANSMRELLLIRFIAGVGLGGIMPNVVALISEYAPARVRVTMMMVVGSTFNVGAAFGGFVASWLIPAFGWRSVFYFAGVVPIVLGILMIPFLPESLQLMVLHGKSGNRIGKWLKKANPAVTLTSDAEFVAREEKRQGVPFVNLFHDNRALVTILLWCVYFANLLNLYLLASWLPTLAQQAGYSTQTAVLVGTTLQVGGLIASMFAAGLSRRFRIIPILAISLAVSSFSIAMVGQPGLSLVLLFVVVFMAGWGVVGSMGMLNATAGTFYPTYLRSTGVGWGLGIGRIGAIVGPLLAGEMIRRNWSNAELFLAPAVLAFGAAVIVASLNWLIKKPQQHTVPAKAEAVGR